MNKLHYVIVLSIGFILFSCANTEELDTEIAQNQVQTNDSSIESMSKENCLKSFSSILSKAAYHSRSVRAFIKDEALKQFDLNYEFLYYPNRNKVVEGNKTFRDILVSYSSEKEIENIEKNLPLLNCLLPDLPMSDITPNDLDPNNPELPVAVDSKEGGTDLYLNGEVVEHLQSNEVPGFNVIVVNENSRVKVSPKTRSSNGEWAYEFKYANFDNTNRVQTRAVNGFDHSKMPSYLYAKAVEAYETGFNKDDGSNRQKAYQRDYIYYGMTPTNTKGSLNRSVTEYLSYMIVDPSVYFKISDQNVGLINDDPRIINTVTVQKKYALTEDQLYERLWKQGNYTFIFEVVRSNSSGVSRMPVNVSPRDLWNFNITYNYRHSTMFRSSKHTYTIDPTKFTSKKYYFNPTDVTFGKWNIAEEGLTRYVSIYEEDDEGVEVFRDYENDFTKLSESAFKGDVKLSLGIGENDKIEGGVSSSSKTSTTSTVKIKYHIARKERIDMLGENIPIYFYDPIILNTIPDAVKRMLENLKLPNGSSFPNVAPFTCKQYSSGSVIFGIDVR